MRRHSLKREQVFAADLSVDHVSPWTSSMARWLTSAIICFCVSSGKSRRYNLPLGLSATGDLPLEDLLGPEVFALEAHIANGRDGDGG